MHSAKFTLTADSVTAEKLCRVLRDALGKIIGNFCRVPPRKHSANLLRRVRFCRVNFAERHTRQRLCRVEKWSLPSVITLGKATGSSSVYFPRYVLQSFCMWCRVKPLGKATGSTGSSSLICFLFAFAHSVKRVNMCSHISPRGPSKAQRWEVGLPTRGQRGIPSHPAECRIDRKFGKKISKIEFYCLGK